MNGTRQGGGPAATSYTATNAADYERLMGRWSGGLARRLIDFAGLAPGDRVLDAGCGTGSLALALAARSEPGRILGVDIAPPYVEFAAARSTDQRLAFAVGDCAALDLPDASFDRSFALLSLNFMAEPARAAAELMRVTRGGTVAAAVWDFAGGLVYQRLFWDTAAMFDPRAATARGRHYGRALAWEGELEALLRGAGAAAVEGTSLTVRFRYADFADYWQPIVHAQGPVGDYVRHLTPEQLEPLAAAVEAAYLSGRPDGPRSLAATAWAVKARA